MKLLFLEVIIDINRVANYLSVFSDYNKEHLIDYDIGSNNVLDARLL